MKKIRIIKTKWDSNKLSTYTQTAYSGSSAYTYGSNGTQSSGNDVYSLMNYDLDKRVDRINDRLREVSYISPIQYNKQTEKIKKAAGLVFALSAYLDGTITDIEELIDEPFYEAYNKPDGIMETLESIVLNEYGIDNKTGITETITTYEEVGYNEFKKVETKKKKKVVGFEDFLDNDDLKGKTKGMPTFAEMYKKQYESQKKNDVDGNFEGVSYKDYVQSTIHRSDVHHTVDRGWLNVVGDVLDTVGVTSLISVFTGTNVFTGEILTPKERDAALFNAVLSIGTTAVIIATAGAGGALAAVGREMLMDMAAGTVGLITAGVLDYMGAPEWMQAIGGVAASIATGYFGTKYVAKVTGKVPFSDKIDIVLSKNDMTMDEFQKFRLIDTADLTPEQIKKMKNIRDASDGITKHTSIRKYITEDDMNNYLNGKYGNLVGGFVARDIDVNYLDNYVDVVESMRLDYVNGNGVRPFPDGGDSYAYMKFKTENAKDIHIPRNSDFGSSYNYEPPYTGNGFTGARNDNIVPEFEFGGRQKIQDGAELHQVVNGVDTIVGEYDGNLEKFIDFRR